MPNLNDLKIYLKNEDLKEGEVLTFMDAGEIKDVDFSPTKDGSKIKRVFQINVELPDGRVKLLTLNKSSQDSLEPEYGKNTDDWVGRQASVTFVKQRSFGKLLDVLVLVPVEGKAKIKKAPKKETPVEPVDPEAEGETPGWAEEIVKD